MSDPGEAVRENYRKQGDARTTHKIIATLKSRICFKFLEGECPHGSCYDNYDMVQMLKSDTVPAEERPMTPQDAQAIVEISQLVRTQTTEAIIEQLQAFRESEEERLAGAPHVTYSQMAYYLDGIQACTHQIQGETK